MAFLTWLKGIFGCQNNRICCDKTCNLTVGESQNLQLTAWGNNDMIKGLRFCATIQLRTPLHVLKHHNEFFNGSGTPPRIAEESWQGVWLPVTKSFKELFGKDIKEFEGTMSSDVGYIPSDGGNYLIYLLALRGIVERTDSIYERLSELKSELRNKKWEDFVQKLGGEKAIIHKFFPRFIETLPGLQKETVVALRKLNLTTPASIITSPDEILLTLKGIGPTRLKKIRQLCVGTSDPASEYVDRVKK